MTYRLFLLHLSDGLLMLLTQQHHLTSLLITSSKSPLTDDLLTVSAASQRWSAHTAPPAASSYVSFPLSSFLMTYRLFLQHLSNDLLILLPQQNHLTPLLITSSTSLLPLASLFLTSSTSLLSNDLPTVSAASQRWSAHTAPPAAPSCVSFPN